MLDIIGQILMLLLTLLSVLLLLPFAFLVSRSSALGSVCIWLTHFFDAVNINIARKVMWFTLAMALIQLTIVILRYAFGINFIWLQESVVYLFGASFLLTSGYALMNNDHVRVDIFYRDASERHKAVVDLAGTYFLLFPVCILIVWASGPYVSRSWQVLESSTEASGLQIVYILKTLIPIFAILLAMAGFSLATRAASDIILSKGGET